VSNLGVHLLVLVFAALLARAPAVREPSPIAVLQHKIEALSGRVQVAIADLASARTADEKRHADAALVDLRLELADLSDRVEAERVQSQR